MKDITRIHIAKVPYSIELTAKKELESYISALEAYTADADLLQDIEIRITELLLERGVKQEEVISSVDVAAIRVQLGEPREFMTDEASEEVDAEILSKEDVRKLYRNLDSAVLGGVLSGIASYTRVNALWLRLAFIVLFFMSAGLAALLYFIAWLIVPPAKTAADKLKMAGRPVTLSSIRELNESGISVQTERRTAIIKRTLTTTLGLGAALVALGSVGALAAVAFELSREDNAAQVAGYEIPLILLFISGGLLLALSLLVAVAAFSQKFNKRIWISAIIITMAGCITFGTAVAFAAVQERTKYEAIERNMIEVSEKLPTHFESVTTLSINMPESTRLHYIVDTTTPTIKQRMLRESPKTKVSIENNTATISAKEPRNRTYGGETTVTIYGPAVKNIVTINGNVSYDTRAQPDLKIEARGTSIIELAESRIDALDATLEGATRLTGNQASIMSITLALSGRPSVDLGNIKTLKVKGPDACAAYTTATVNVQNILATSYEYNGAQTIVRSIEDPCFSLTIADEE